MKVVGHAYAYISMAHGRGNRRVEDLLVEAEGELGGAVNVEGLAGLPGVAGRVFEMREAGEEIGQGDFGF